MADLYMELKEAAFSVCETDLAHLRRLGALNAGVAAFGMVMHQFGLMRIADGEDGLFHPDPDGRRSLVLPVVEDGELIDLVSFSTSTPDNWRLRTGLGTALGLHDGWCHCWPDEVQLHRNPLQWLRGGCSGLCVVDWDAPDLIRLNDLPSITVDDEALRGQLRKALLRPIRLVPIHLNSESRRNAA